MSVNWEHTTVTKKQNAKTQWGSISVSAKLDTRAMDRHVKVCLDYLQQTQFSLPWL